jgi:hypothetical protein
VEEKGAAVDKTVEDVHKLFLDEKENSYACLLGVNTCQEKEAQLVRPQFDLFKDRNGKESPAVKEMETRLNLAENLLCNLFSECSQ